MLASIQYSAAEIAFGVVVFLLACVFMGWMCEGVLWNRRRDDD